MSAGLFALLDDIAALAKAAATSLDDVAGAAGKASTKAVGVVVDDTAVTPQYVSGISPARELPVIAKIARNSLLNKAAIMVVALTLSHLLPWVLTPILMLGGAYLCFEGAEKILQRLPGLRRGEAPDPSKERSPEAESKIVAKATRTDLILSTEIMVVALNEVRQDTLGIQIGALVAVAILITVMVYGVVGLLVKMDDVGLAMTQRSHRPTIFLGKLLLKAMPNVLKTLSIVGMAAMLWVGGHLFVHGLADLGCPSLAAFIERVAKAVGGSIPSIARAGEWTISTLGAMVFGFLLGAAVTLVVWGGKMLVKRLRK